MIPHTFRAESASSPRAGEKGKTRPEELGKSRNRANLPVLRPELILFSCVTFVRDCVASSAEDPGESIKLFTFGLLCWRRRGEGFINFLATFYTCWIWDVDCCEAGRRCDGILCARGVRESEPFFFPKNLWDDFFFRFRL